MEKVKPWKDDIEAVMEEFAALKEQVTDLKQQVNTLSTETKDMVSAFNAAQGAFVALEWIARTVKPIIVIVTAIGAFTLWVKGVKI